MLQPHTTLLFFPYLSLTGMQDGGYFESLQEVRFSLPFFFFLDSSPMETLAGVLVLLLFTSVLDVANREMILLS